MQNSYIKVLSEQVLSKWIHFQNPFSLFRMHAEIQLRKKKFNIAIQMTLEHILN